MAKIKLAADFSDFLKLCLRNEVRFMVIGGYERRDLVKIGRMMVPFIYLQDLKINKLASGRPKDLQDLEELP